MSRKTRKRSPCFRRIMMAPFWKIITLRWPLECSGCRGGGSIALCYSRANAMETNVSTQPKIRITPEEYLELERKADRKSEYLNGEMFEMPGVTWDHSGIVLNIATELRN